MIKKLDDDSKPIRVGVLGAGEVSQVVHFPTLALLSHLYTVVGVCDVSQEAVRHAQRKFNIPFGCLDSKELCCHPEIDLILIASADEYHASQAIQAADQGKAVFIEKPMAMTRKEAEAVEEARIRNNVHISVAYMRRYTSVWSSFLEEIASSGPINFARVFDYPGPNSTFVAQTSTFPKTFLQDISPENKTDRSNRAAKIGETILGPSGKSQDTRLYTCWRLLGGLGSHDISCMRHAFGGIPKECTSAFASPNGLFIGATFLYSQAEGTEGSDFLVSYETGIHGLGTFDAYIEVYFADKCVRIDYDTPYVKGLPIKLTIRENCGKDGKGFQERVVRPTFVDAYSAEFIRLSKSLREGTPVTNSQSILRQGWEESSEMCSPTDAMHDLDIFEMIMKRLM